MLRSNGDLGFCQGTGKGGESLSSDPATEGLFWSTVCQCLWFSHLRPDQVSQRLGARAELVPLRPVCIGKQRNLKKKKKIWLPSPKHFRIPICKTNGGRHFYFYFYPSIYSPFNWFSWLGQVTSSLSLSVCLSRMDCDRILLGRERQTVRFSSDCHCNAWSFETYFIHP